MKVDSEKQLDLSYSGDERFSLLLKSSAFFIMLEVHQTHGSGSEDGLKEVLNAAGKHQGVQAVLIDDRLLDDNDKGGFELVQEAVVRTGKPVVPVISGKDSIYDNVVRKLNRYRSVNIRDFLAVTGNLLKAHREENAAVAPGEYEDALRILKDAEDNGNDNCMGVAVNPFKYVAEERQAQYAKLMRKIHKGVNFVVSQAGWDMKKYQELLWFMRSRNALKPLVARVVHWTNETWLEEALPGVPVPLNVKTLADKKEDLMDLTAMMALGCKHIGYSGVILAGITRADELNALLENIQHCSEAYSDYKSWCTAWNKRYHGVSFVPYAERFGRQPLAYLYGALMEPEVSEYDPIASRPIMQNITQPTLQDRWQAGLRESKLPAYITEFLGRITGVDMDEDVATQLCLNLKNEQCVKRLTFGPCGGSALDGMCECGSRVCFFERVLRLAVAKNQMECLENGEQPNRK